MPIKYKIYTDGAYAPSRNMGGWAFVVLKDLEKISSNFGPVPDTTNNRMEITATIEAIKWSIEQGIQEIEIFSDSIYVIGTMTQNWKRKKNNDLWDILDTLTSQINIKWTHVKGHNGDKYNELCDALAVEATKTIIKND